MVLIISGQGCDPSESKLLGTCVPYEGTQYYPDCMARLYEDNEGMYFVTTEIPIADNDDEDYSQGVTITTYVCPYTPKLAKDWVIEHLGMDAYIKLFGRL